MQWQVQCITKWAKKRPQTSRDLDPLAESDIIVVVWDFADASDHVRVDLTDKIMMS